MVPQHKFAEIAKRLHYSVLYTVRRKHLLCDGDFYYKLLTDTITTNSPLVEDLFS